MKTVAPRRLSFVSCVFAAALSLVFAGFAHALSVDIVVPETNPAEVYQHGRTPFLAAAFDEKGGDVTDLATFTWSFPDAKEPVVGNPAFYRFQKTGKFTVTVTATLEKDSGSDQIAVNVVEAQVTRAGADDYVFEARRGSHVFPGAGVCDETQLVVRQIPDDVLPFEWYVARFDRFEDGQWVTVETTQPGWSQELGWHATHSWDTTEDPNEAVQWRAHLELDEVGMEPPIPQIINKEGTWTPGNTVIKATGDEIIKHHANDASHTISWNLTHYTDAAIDPEFDVTVRIYNLAGTLIKTIVSNGVEAGQGSALWNTDLPAAAGIYAYTIHATHSEDPPMPVICSDADKSQVLEIGDVDLDWFTYDARALTLAGEIRYTLNRSAGSAQLSVFHPDLTLVQAWEVPSVTGTSAFEFQFPVLADPATPYWFVLEAIEADAEAQENRDELAKPALQKGGWRVLPLRAYSFRGALFPSASAAIDWASQQQGHPQEGEFYPHPSYTPAEHLLNWDVKSSYERLADHDVNWNHNPVADGAVFYIGHGEPGVMLVGDEYANGRKEIWTGQGSDADFLGCFYMGNPRFGASALRRANVVVVAACWSADDREPGAPNGPRASVMDEFTNRGAGAAIGYHGLLSEAVATAFCDHFWLVASKQCEVRYEGGEQVHVPRETSIQLAFDEARQISGTPTRWECVGSAAADRLRPAAYGGDGP